MAHMAENSVKPIALNIITVAIALCGLHMFLSCPQGPTMKRELQIEQMDPRA